MIGGARRQLPSWMFKSQAVDKSSNSEVKEAKKEIDSEKFDPKPCKTQKKGKREQHDTEVPLLEKESHLLKKSKARSSKRKSSKEEKNLGDDLDESDLERKVNVKVKKRVRCGDESLFLKHCETNKKTSKRERMSNKKPEGHIDDLCESDMEKQERKRYRGNAPRRKKQTVKEHDETVESIPSEDELTMEDLISIAEELLCDHITFLASLWSLEQVCEG